MARNAYSKEEIILCTYAALFEAKDFGGVDAIHKIQDRSVSSIRMKISNIAAMLDEEGYKRANTVSPLTGTPPGYGARRTDWDVVKELIILDKTELLKKCTHIISGGNNPRSTEKSTEAQYVKKNYLN